MESVTPETENKIAETVNVTAKTKSGLDKLPKRELEKNFAFYQKALKDLHSLSNAIDLRLNELHAASDRSDPSVQSIYETAKLRCEKNDVIAKMSIQEYNMSMYQDRIDEHRPIYEKEVEECNKNFDEIFALGKLIGAKNPVSPIAMAIAGYESAMEDAGMDEELRQELRNEVYKSLKFQVQVFEQRAKKALNKPNNMKKV